MTIIVFLKQFRKKKVFISRFLNRMEERSVISECASHIGYKYTLNEDAYANYPEHGLWIISDGMGGHNSGKIASNMAVERVYNDITNGLSLSTAIQNTHKAILQAGANDIEKQGMGSTIVVLKIQNGFYEIASVGDSRAYLFSNKQLKQITSDHTLVQELINQGKITQEQAKIHPDRNLLTQALGSVHHDEVIIDIFNGELKCGDQLLLCTDGLTNRIQDYKIENILKHSESLHKAIDNLIESALAFGGRDNITVILVQLAS
jgi:PPM family protein phosphatase